VNLRERARIETPKTILAAAHEVFGEEGYEGATIAKIAERAGVSSGAVTLYFRKEDLPAALAEQMLERMVDAAEAASAGVEELGEAVEATVRAIYAAGADYRDALVTINRALELVETETQWREHTAPLKDCIERVVRRFQASGQVDPGLDPEISATVVADLIAHSLRPVLCFGDERFAAEVIRVAQRALARG
jgi:AcrR family transcriptional regulator